MSKQIFMFQNIYSVKSTKDLLTGFYIKGIVVTKFDSVVPISRY